MVQKGTWEMIRLLIVLLVLILMHIKRYISTMNVLHLGNISICHTNAGVINWRVYNFTVYSNGSIIFLGNPNENKLRKYINFIGCSIFSLVPVLRHTIILRINYSNRFERHNGMKYDLNFVKKYFLFGLYHKLVL